MFLCSLVRAWRCTKKKEVNSPEGCWHCIKNKKKCREHGAWECRRGEAAPQGASGGIRGRFGGTQIPRWAVLQGKAAEPDRAALRGKSKAALAEELPAFGEGCFPPGDG